MTESNVAECALVADFIAAINAQDVKAAELLVADGFTFTAPGPTTFQSLSSFFEWAAGRYRRARYSYDCIDVVQDAGNCTVLYARGTLSGELNDGSRFADIRFIDRFTVRNHKILTKETWSDMADFLRRRGG